MCEWKIKEALHTLHRTSTLRTNICWNLEEKYSWRKVQVAARCLHRRRRWSFPWREIQICCRYGRNNWNTYWRVLCNKIVVCPFTWSYHQWCIKTIQRDKKHFVHDWKSTYWWLIKFHWDIYWGMPIYLCWWHRYFTGRRGCNIKFHITTIFSWSWS